MSAGDFEIRPVVTFIHGPIGSGKTSLARRLAEERTRAGFSATVVDAEGATVKALCAAHRVNYLYVCSIDAPSPEDQLMLTSIRLGAARAAA